MSYASTEKVLFVDDDPMLLEAMKRQLRRRFPVATALGGHEAIERFRSEGPFAVVITDRNMPGMAGRDLIGKIHEMSPATVVVMLTGNSADDVTTDDEQTEIFRVLTKPCSRGVLCETIESAIGRYQDQAAAI